MPDKAMTDLLAERDAWKHEAERWQRDAEMYARSWERSLREFDGTITRKTHLIDALVLTTQALVKRALERQAGLPAAVTTWRDAEQKRLAAVAARDARIGACQDAGVPTEFSLEAKLMDEARDEERIAREAMTRYFFPSEPEPEFAEVKGSP